MPASGRWAREAIDFGEEPWTRPKLVRQVGHGVATLSRQGRWRMVSQAGACSLSWAAEPPAVERGVRAAHVGSA